MLTIRNLHANIDGKEILNGIPTNTVTNSAEESEARGLKVTCTKEHKASDYEMILTGESFSIVLHGTQKAKNGLSERDNEIIKDYMHIHKMNKKEATKYCKDNGLI